MLLDEQESVYTISLQPLNASEKPQQSMPELIAE
jgi:hypothetical protein